MLPKLPYAENSTVYQAIHQRGINLSEMASEGELSDSHGVTTDNYPVITQRRKRRSIGSYVRPTSIFFWDGLLVVDGTDLYYKGNIVGNVTPGEKQFAVVNTKLIVWPDKKYLDLQYGTLRPLGGSITTIPNSTTFDTNKITISSAVPTIAKETSEKVFSTDTPEKIVVYTALSFNQETRVWTKTPQNGTEKAVEDIRNGDLTIPYKNDAGGYVLRTKTGDDYIGEENRDGIYYKITSANVNTTSQEFKWEKFNVSSSYYEYYEEHWEYLTEISAPEISGGSGYRFNSSTGTFTVTGSSTVGWGMPGTAYVGGGSSIDEVTYSGGNIGSVSTGTAVGPYYDEYDSRGSTSYGFVYGPRNEYPNDGVKNGYWYVNRGETGHSGTATIGYDVIDTTGGNGKFTSQFVVGDIVKIEGSEKVKDGQTEFRIKAVTDYTVTFDGTPFTAGAEPGSVTIYKPVPDLDYICASDNRLWGVSNKDKTIYASALGMPGDFYTFSGVSTDSYAVAVGTDKDFTGIIAYGDAVLAWKENVLHKIMGKNPSEYYMSSYIVNGVEAGSGLSMQVVNEVLYYKGIDGVYAYTGTVPYLISAAFGMHRYRYAAAGSDDTHYYISMERTDGSAWVLFVYDILRDMWIKEDEMRCSYFTEQENKVLFLSDNVIYKMGQDDSPEVIDWLVEYAPTFETHTSTYSSSSMLNRKDYMRLIIRVEVNGTLTVQTRNDDKPWRTAKVVKTDHTNVYTIPLPPMRVDKFQLRMFGTGEVCIRSVERELTVGSKK